MSFIVGMYFLAAILMVAAGVIYSKHPKTPRWIQYAAEDFYLCDMYGRQSALYISRTLPNIGVVEYRRITGGPDGRFPRPESDWFRPTFSARTGLQIDRYSRIAKPYALRLMHEHAMASVTQDGITV